MVLFTKLKSSIMHELQSCAFRHIVNRFAPTPNVCVIGNTLGLIHCKWPPSTLYMGCFVMQEDCSHLDKSRAPQPSSRQTVWLRGGGRRYWVSENGASTSLSTVIAGVHLVFFTREDRKFTFCIFICLHKTVQFVSSDRCRGAQSLEIYDRTEFRMATWSLL